MPVRAISATLRLSQSKIGSDASAELAIEVENMCKPARQRAMPSGLDTTEGRVVHRRAERRVVSPRTRQRKGDGQTFEPGWK